MFVNKDYPLQYTLNNIEIYIHKRVLSIFKTYRQEKRDDNERFGVLIGSKSSENDFYWIDEVTTPFFDDVATRISFTMKDPCHQKIIDQTFQESGGENVYMGTWHTHPQRVPKPSFVDKEDWLRCLKRNQKRQLFFVIVGTDEIEVFIRNKKSFVSMVSRSFKDEYLSNK